MWNSRSILSVFNTPIRWYSKNRTSVNSLKPVGKEATYSKPEWAKRDQSLKQRYGGWNPTRKLSRQQMQDVRNFQEQLPHLRTVELAQYFNISPEAIRRILKSSWTPKESEEDDIMRRDDRRKARNRSHNQKMEEDLDHAFERLNYGRSDSLEQVVATKRTDRSNIGRGYKRAYDIARAKNKRPRNLVQVKPFVTGPGDTIE